MNWIRVLFYTDKDLEASLASAKQIECTATRRSFIRDLRRNAKIFGELRALNKWWHKVKDTANRDYDVAQKNLKRLIDLRGYLWTREANPCRYVHY